MCEKIARFKNNCIFLIIWIKKLTGFTICGSCAGGHGGAYREFRNSQGRIILVLAGMSVILAGCGGRRQRAMITYQIGTTQESSAAYESGTEEPAVEKTQEQSETGISSPSADPALYVFVCGAVIHEGVYALEQGDRVCDAVRAAGGYAESADTSYVNQAAFVSDEQQLWIPTVKEAKLLRKREASAAGTSVLDENRIGSRLTEDSSANTPLSESTEAAGSGRESDISASGSGESTQNRININSADLEELRQIPGVGEVKAQRIIEYRKEHGPFGNAEEITNVTGIGDASYARMKDFITVD